MEWNGTFRVEKHSDSQVFCLSSKTTSSITHTSTNISYTKRPILGNRTLYGYFYFGDNHEPNFLGSEVEIKIFSKSQNVTIRGYNTGIRLYIWYEVIWVINPQTELLHYY